MHPYPHIPSPGMPVLLFLGQFPRWGLDLQETAPEQATPQVRSAGPGAVHEPGGPAGTHAKGAGLDALHHMALGNEVLSDRVGDGRFAHSVSRKALSMEAATSLAERPVCSCGASIAVSYTHLR